MGLLTWVLAGVLAFGIARGLRSGGALRWPAEAAVAIAAAVLFGMIATAFDFGGWKELEWRAAAMALAGTSLVLALTRIARLALERRR